MGQPSAQEPSAQEQTFVQEPPMVEPSQFDVGGSSSGRVKHKARKGGNTKQKTKRLSRLGRWLGIGESELESDPIEATPASQTASTPAFGTSGPVAATQSSQTTRQQPEVQEQVNLEQNNVAQLVPRNFIRQRGRSQRILQKKLAKNHQGIGSSSSNVHDLD